MLAALACAPARGADYRIDSARSHAEFSVRLLWVRQISGRFTDIRGEVTLNPLRDTAVVEATVEVNSVAMTSSRLRRWVLDPEFFDVRRFPTIRFHLRTAGRARARPGRRPAGLAHPARRHPAGAFPARARPAARCKRIPTATSWCSGEIKRSDYGMHSHSTAVADTVQLGLMHHAGAGRSLSAGRIIRACRCAACS